MTNQGPLYMQIKEYILEEINNGKFKPGDKLPSEKDFTDLFEVSRVTVRSALAELQSEGVISRISGRGTFVSEDLKLDYTDKENKKDPNKKASSLIGVILCHLDSPFHIHLLTSIEREIDRQGYQMVFGLSGDDADKEEKLISEMVGAGVEGLIIYPVDGKFYNEQILRLSIENFPLALVDRYLPGISACSVYSDNKKGSYMVGEYLALRGHKGIALISPNAKGTIPLLDRLDGFSDALNDNNIAIRSDYWITDLVNCPVPDKKARHLENINKIERLLKANRQITAIYAINGLTALMAYKAVTNLGHKVPEDIEVICFDNTTGYFSIEDYKISFIDHSEEFMGKAVVKSLVEIINGGKPKNTIVPCTLIAK